jgi:hypothetical protein
MELIIDRKIFFRGLSAISAFFLGLPSYSAQSAASSTDKGEGRRRVISGVIGVACKSRVLMSDARSFVAASRIESTPMNNEESE